MFKQRIGNIRVYWTSLRQPITKPICIVRATNQTLVTISASVPMYRSATRIAVVRSFAYRVVFGTRLRNQNTRVAQFGTVIPISSGGVACRVYRDKWFKICVALALLGGFTGLVGFIGLVGFTGLGGFPGHSVKIGKAVNPLKKKLPKITKFIPLCSCTQKISHFVKFWKAAIPYLMGIQPFSELFFSMVRVSVITLIIT